MFKKFYREMILSRAASAANETLKTLSDRQLDETVGPCGKMQPFQDAKRKYQLISDICIKCIAAILIYLK